MADGFEEDGTVFDISEKGDVLSYRSVQLQGLGIKSLSAGRFDLTGDRAEGQWTVTRDGRLSGVRTEGNASALLRSGDGLIYRAQNRGFGKNGYISRLQRVNDQAKPIAEVDLKSHITGMTEFGDRIIASGDSDHYQGQLFVIDRPTMRIVSQWTYPQMMTMQRCYPDPNPNFALCIEHHVEDNEKETGNRHLSRIDLTTGQRDELGVSEHKIVEVFHDGGKRRVVTIEGIGDIRDRKWEPELKIGNPDFRVEYIIRNGEIADIHIGPPINVMIGDKADRGAIVRVNLRTMKEIRRTPLHLPERPWSGVVVLPREFFEGHHVIG
ncbi:hypothetical protein [Austwickia sp. TVS 96-490-7B]|uniref:hypothetical protein n=1 Tax=Austwickia sp. TVS 96-490-7B TaxID=2830843 RepID=UPI001C57C1E0|nr:hypothetical protein [Austwickia sp. TVS 96-490-7B]